MKVEVAGELPRVILHNAVSVDGRIDGYAVDIGLFYELASHWQEDATLAGADTMLGAQGAVPSEDESAFIPPAWDADDRRPWLVVPDSRGRLRSWHYWRQLPYWRVGVALCSRATPSEHLAYLEERHIDTIVAGEDHVDLHEALTELVARYGVHTVRVDSGGTLNGALLRAGLVDEVSLLVHPYLVGGVSPRSMFRVPDPGSGADAVPLRLMHVEKLADDIVWLRYEVIRPGQ